LNIADVLAEYCVDHSVDLTFRDASNVIVDLKSPPGSAARPSIKLPTLQQ
jgi:hypothetical protein